MADDEKAQGPSPHLINEVADWLMGQALAGTTADQLIEQCSLRLNAAGIPVWRANISFQILHPLYEAISWTWYRDTGLEEPGKFGTGGSVDTRKDWDKSPPAHLVRNNLPFLRRRLTGPDAMLDLPAMEEFREKGGTDYLVYIERFNSSDFLTPESDGMVGSWVTDRAGGFSDLEIQALRRIQRRLAVACKMSIREQITRNVLGAYLGRDAGEEVLHGKIRLGDGQNIHAVIWFSDLRRSTALADKLPPDEFIETVNAYFACSAGAVLAHDGEVLRFVGDAVLAIFPIRDEGMSEADACARALAAAADAQQRLADLNEQRAADEKELIAFGIGLHLGDLMYGNIGVPERVEFSVIGPAANEAARLEDLTKTLERPVWVSEPFANAHDIAWEDLGAHALRGVGEPMEVFAPPPPPVVSATSRAAE